MNLKGKRIVVAGSSMGIGQAVAVRCAAEGAKVVINARGMEALQETQQRIQSVSGTAVTSCGSVADYDDAGRLIQACVDAFGGIDVLVNCAGIVEPQGSNILNISRQVWQQLIDVHLTGTFNTCRHAAPVMAAQKQGTIINTGSHAFLGMYGGTGYAAGKGGTVSLSMALAMDLREHNINVNVVCPGAKTRMSSGEDYERLIKKLNQRGLLSDDLMENSLAPPSPDYVAALYAYLASDKARDISGRVFWGAGGYVGVFRKNPDQLLALRDHEIYPPWTLDELEQKMANPALHQPEKLFNVILGSASFQWLVRQELLLKLANSRLVKNLQERARRKHREEAKQVADQ